MDRAWIDCTIMQCQYKMYFYKKREEMSKYPLRKLLILLVFKKPNAQAAVSAVYYIQRLAEYTDLDCRLGLEHNWRKSHVAKANI